MSDTLQFVVVTRKTQVTLQLDRLASQRQTEVCRTFTVLQAFTAQDKDYLPTVVALEVLRNLDSHFPTQT